MVEPWEPSAVGVLRLPSGRLVRGRGLRKATLSEPAPTFGVYLVGTPPPDTAWDSRWVRWPDYRLPPDRQHARDVLVEAWERALDNRVEIACGGGRGRTGTALACLAVIDGVPAEEVVAFVRRHYDARAIE